MSQPWLKFYPSDWRADPQLRMCSVGARGLWMEMLCIMHEADPCGSFLINGKPISNKQFASLAGCTVAEVETYLAELEEAGVFSREDNGTVYSRRIRRDMAKAEKDRENGKRGGNPNLRNSVNMGVNPPSNPTVNGGDKAQKPEARVQKEDNHSAQLHSPASAAPSPSANLDRVLALCSNALGAAAPADPVIGPMLPLVEAFGEKRVAETLASEARRPRKKPIRTWVLWADIAREVLVAAPPIAAPDPDSELIEMRNGFKLEARKVLVALDIYRKDPKKWNDHWGMPPPKNPRLLKFCAERGIELPGAPA